MTTVKAALWTWVKIALLTVLIVLSLLLPGCELLGDLLGVESPSVILNPTIGTLTIGRNDLIVIGVSIAWPFDIEDGRYTGAVDLKIVIPSSLASTNFESMVGVSNFVFADKSGSSAYTLSLQLFRLPSFPPRPPPPPGVYKLTVAGKPFELTIVEQGSFEMIVEPNFDRQTQRSTKTRTVRLIRAPGFTSSVNLSLDNPPQGITATFNPNSVSGVSSLMSLTIGDSVSPGVKNLRVIGTDGNVTKMASFTVEVVPSPYIVRLTPDTLRLAPGQVGSVGVRIIGVNLPVTLLEPIEPYVSFQFLPNPTDSLSTMTVTVAAQAQAGTRVIPIIGRFSNGQSARDTLILNIVPGLPWRTVFSQNGFSLFGLGFENSSTGFGMAVTQSAARSTDGGNSWTIVNPPPSNANDVAVVGPLRAVAVGGNNKIMRTYDGGLSWTERSSGLTSGSFLAIGFNPSNPNIGVAVGRDGVITRTTNGGDDWAAVSPENPDSPHWYDVSLFGPTGTIVGASSFGFNGTILRSTDYGLSWSLQATTTSGRPLNGVSFSNSNSGIIVGNDGVILRTDDGGAQWNTLISPTQATLYDVSMLSSQEATTVGSSGTILRTFDGGQTWVRQSVPPAAQSATLWKVFVFPNNSAVCLGNEFGCIILRRD